MGNDPILSLSQSEVLNLYTKVTPNKSLAEGSGIEPLIIESKSIVIPFN